MGGTAKACCILRTGDGFPSPVRAQWMCRVGAANGRIAPSLKPKPLATGRKPRVMHPSGANARAFGLRLPRTWALPY